MKIQALDYSVDLLRNLLWQYNEAERLEKLIQLKQDWYDRSQSEFWADWVTDVFDLQTANDFGLSVWAIILDIPLVVTPDPDPPDKPIWGFGSGNTRVNFTNGNFASTSGGFGLTTAQKRLVLRLRYFQLVGRGTIPEINDFMARLFGPSVVYANDTGGMRLRYVFSAPPSSALELVLTAYDLLPRPAGVLVDYVVAGEDGDGWGFGRYRQNFNNGNFYHGP